MSQRYAIPGFSRHTLIREDDGSWTMIGTRGIPVKGRYKAGDRREFKLAKDSGGQATVQLGRLILLALVGPPLEGQECCHGDGNPTNNDPCNLRWGTHAENIRDTVRHGRHGNGKLTPEMVKAIRTEWAGSAPGTQARLATKYGVRRATISDLLRSTRGL